MSNPGEASATALATAGEVASSRECSATAESTLSLEECSAETSNVSHAEDGHSGDSSFRLSSSTSSANPGNPMLLKAAALLLKTERDETRSEVSCFGAGSPGEDGEAASAQCTDTRDDACSRSSAEATSVNEKRTSEQLLRVSEELSRRLEDTSRLTSSSSRGSTNIFSCPHSPPAFEVNSSRASKSTSPKDYPQISFAAPVGGPNRGSDGIAHVHLLLKQQEQLRGLHRLQAEYAKKCISGNSSPEEIASQMLPYLLSALTANETGRDQSAETRECSSASLQPLEEKPVKGLSDFNSAIDIQQQMLPPEVDVLLQECATCGRRFETSRLEVHSRICQVQREAEEKRLKEYRQKEQQKAEWRRKVVEKEKELKEMLLKKQREEEELLLQKKLQVKKQREAAAARFAADAKRRAKAGCLLSSATPKLRSKCPVEKSHLEEALTLHGAVSDTEGGLQRPSGRSSVRSFEEKTVVLTEQRAEVPAAVTSLMKAQSETQVAEEESRFVEESDANGKDPAGGSVIGAREESILPESSSSAARNVVFPNNAVASIPQETLSIEKKLTTTAPSDHKPHPPSQEYSLPVEIRQQRREAELRCTSTSVGKVTVQRIRPQDRWRTQPMEQCPHCMRRFGIKAFTRHVEVCAERERLKARRPAPCEKKTREEERRRATTTSSKRCRTSEVPPPCLSIPSSKSETCLSLEVPRLTSRGKEALTSSVSKLQVSPSEQSVAPSPCSLPPLSDALSSSLFCRFIEATARAAATAAVKAASESVLHLRAPICLSKGTPVVSQSSSPRPQLSVDSPASSARTSRKSPAIKDTRSSSSAATRRRDVATSPTVSCTDISLKAEGSTKRLDEEPVMSQACRDQCSKKTDEEKRSSAQSEGGKSMLLETKTNSKSESPTAHQRHADLKSSDRKTQQRATSQRRKEFRSQEGRYSEGSTCSKCGGVSLSPAKLKDSTSSSNASLMRPKRPSLEEKPTSHLRGGNTPGVVGASATSSLEGQLGERLSRASSVEVSKEETNAACENLKQREEAADAVSLSSGLSSVGGSFENSFQNTEVQARLARLREEQHLLVQNKARLRTEQLELCKGQSAEAPSFPRDCSFPAVNINAVTTARSETQKKEDFHVPSLPTLQMPVLVGGSAVSVSGGTRRSCAANTSADVPDGFLRSREAAALPSLSRGCDAAAAFHPRSLDRQLSLGRFFVKPLTEAGDSGSSVDPSSRVLPYASRSAVEEAPCQVAASQVYRQHTSDAVWKNPSLDSSTRCLAYPLQSFQDQQSLASARDARVIPSCYSGVNLQNSQFVSIGESAQSFARHGDASAARYVSRDFQNVPSASQALTMTSRSLFEAPERTLAPSAQTARPACASSSRLSGWDLEPDRQLQLRQLLLAQKAEEERLARVQKQQLSLLTTQRVQPATASAFPKEAAVASFASPGPVPQSVSYAWRIGQNNNFRVSEGVFQRDDSMRGNGAVLVPRVHVQSPPSLAPKNEFISPQPPPASQRLLSFRRYFGQ